MKLSYNICGYLGNRRWLLSTWISQVFTQIVYQRINTGLGTIYEFSNISISIPRNLQNQHSVLQSREFSSKINLPLRSRTQSWSSKKISPPHMPALLSCIPNCILLQSLVLPAKRVALNLAIQEDIEQQNKAPKFVDWFSIQNFLLKFHLF